MPTAYPKPDAVDDAKPAGGFSWSPEKSSNCRIIDKAAKQELRAMGTSKNLYPSFSAKKFPVNQRLKDVFGYPYRVELPNENAFVDCMSGLTQHSGNICRPVGARAVAINETTGDIAVFGHRCLAVYQPIGSNQFYMSARYEHQGGLYLDNKHNADMLRVRFVDQSIFVFFPHSKHIHEYHFDSHNQTICETQVLSDDHFKTWGVVDFQVTSTFLLVLWDNWIGVYLRQPTFKWYHAIAYAKPKSSPRPVSFEMVGVDELSTEMERNVVVSKESLKNYLFINCNQSILALHPSNPTFDFMHVAKGVENGASFCLSRKFGVFWLNSNGRQLIQSSRLHQHDEERVLLGYGRSLDDGQSSLQLMPTKITQVDEQKECLENVECFTSLLFDETFGLSGRLLIQCRLTDHTFAMHQMFDRKELAILQQELAAKEYMLLPGCNEKPFNLIVFVFEMLYGSECIDGLIESSKFNPCHQAIQWKNGVEVPEIGQLSVGSQCLVLDENVWRSATVQKCDQDSVDIAFVSTDVICNKVVKKTMKRSDTNLKIVEHGKAGWSFGDNCVVFDAACGHWRDAVAQHITYPGGYLTVAGFVNGKRDEIVVPLDKFGFSKNIIRLECSEKSAINVGEKEGEMEYDADEEYYVV